MSVAGEHVTRFPLQPPVQPVNLQPFAATARSASASPAGKLFVHFGEQEIVPCPAVVARTGIRSGPKTAVAPAGWSSLRAQSPLPVQEPDHRTNRSVFAGTALNARMAPWSHSVVHAAVHATPGTSLSI